jgi:hypothetical protein
MSSSSLHAASTTDVTTRGKSELDDDDDDDDDDDRLHQVQHAAFSSPHHVEVPSPTVRPPLQTNHQNGQKKKNKKLRVLVITTMGSERQEQIRCMFRHAALSSDFEEPVFSPGVPSRSLRNRLHFLQACHEAGLVPDVEWQVIQQQAASSSLAANARPDSKNFFSCLDNVPIGKHHHRVGSPADCQVHYSVELWRKAKTINRGRSVLACTLAHLMAMRKFTADSPSAGGDDSSFDVLLEDNVRVPVQESICATRIRQTIQASRDYEKETGTTCHLRYYGWLGSLENLQWMHECHLPKRAFRRPSSSSSCNADETTTTATPFPTTQDIEIDLLEKKEKDSKHEELKLPTSALQAQSLKEEEEEEHDHDDHQQQPTAVAVPEQAATSSSTPRPPGGTPVWGAYAYWISKQGYEHVLSELQNDVGSLLWKGKRARYYCKSEFDSSS